MTQTDVVKPVPRTKKGKLHLRFGLRRGAPSYEVGGRPPDSGLGGDRVFVGGGPYNSGMPYSIVFCAIERGCDAADTPDS